MLQYNKKMIIHALALAPIPLLSLSALGVIILNAEFNLYSIGVVFLAHFLFYLLFYWPSGYSFCIYHFLFSRP